MVPEGVHIEEPWRREEHGEHVAKSHCHQDHVGGCPHVPPGEDHHDQRVEDRRDDEQERGNPSGKKSIVSYFFNSQNVPFDSLKLIQCGVLL